MGISAIKIFANALRASIGGGNVRGSPKRRARFCCSSLVNDDGDNIEDSEYTIDLIDNQSLADQGIASVISAELAHETKQSM